MKLKKKLATILTSLTLITQATSCTSSQTEFDTIRGKRDLADYSDFLIENGINYRKCTVYSEGELVYIKEKKYEKYIVTEDTTIDDILSQYCIDDFELTVFNGIKEYGKYEHERSVNVYKIDTHVFSLTELDNNCEYHFHVVQPGETIESIANEYGVSENTIRQKNMIQGEPEIGTIIKIPIAYENKMY